MEERTGQQDASKKTARKRAYVYLIEGEDGWWMLRPHHKDCERFTYVCLTREEANAQFLSILKDCWIYHNAILLQKKDGKKRTFERCAAVGKFCSYDYYTYADVVSVEIAPTEKEKLCQAVRALEAAGREVKGKVPIQFLCRRIGGKEKRRAYASEQKARKAFRSLLDNVWDDDRETDARERTRAECERIGCYDGAEPSWISEHRLYQMEWY
ncbi:hypothetical protein [uncultured Selenomonas sp.]|uniref:hypothetical protein n=1 Tax=uncultured Selenomonas sp. TaxID=159275 RepID=UPI0025DC7C5F|nr:hypothetical protein [uncultured Selenomonas sp.]